MAQQKATAQASHRTTVRDPADSDIDNETSEDDGPFSRGRLSRKTHTPAKPYTLEPLRDSPVGSRSVSHSHQHGRSTQTPTTGKSAFSRKSTASTTLSKLIKKEAEGDEDKMRAALEGMLEKKTYIGLVRTVFAFYAIDLGKIG
jgi:hypothetical protein